jgi:hypothetical protein
MFPQNLKFSWITRQMFTPKFVFALEFLSTVGSGSFRCSSVHGKQCGINSSEHFDLCKSYWQHAQCTAFPHCTVSKSLRKRKCLGKKSEPPAKASFGIPETMHVIQRRVLQLQLEPARTYCQSWAIILQQIFI